jgi:hypothetical protein
MMFVMAAVTDGGHLEEDQRQHHKHQRLHKADEHFQHIEGHRQEEGNQECHGRQHDLAGEDIAKETKAKGDDAGNSEINSRMPTKALMPFIKPFGPLKLKNLRK